MFNIYEQLKRYLEPIGARKSYLLPRPALKIINDQYRMVWSEYGNRSVEGSERYEIRKSGMWMDEGKTTNIMDILPGRIEAVRRKGNVFRIMQAGSGSWATFFTGLDSKEVIEVSNSPNWKSLIGKGVQKKHQGLEEVLIEWGFTPGRDFEMIAVHGGKFEIRQTPGLKLISTNIFDRIPFISEHSINLLVSFEMLYQTFGGFYLLEYFDRLLARSFNEKEAGLSVVWPFENGGDQIVLTDANQRPLSLKTAFINLDTIVDYWHEGRHVAWVKDPTKNLRFPIKPYALVTYLNYHDVLVYQVEPNILDSNNIIFHEEADHLDEFTSRAKKVVYFK